MAFGCGCLVLADTKQINTVKIQHPELVAVSLLLSMLSSRSQRPSPPAQQAVTFTGMYLAILAPPVSQSRPLHFSDTQAGRPSDAWAVVLDTSADLDCRPLGSHARTDFSRRLLSASRKPTSVRMLSIGDLGPDGLVRSRTRRHKGTHDAVRRPHTSL